jgi:S-adenosylmethionine:tRNA ribosyltransferase-isomerase
MNLSDLDFQYPQELVATEPLRPSRVAFVCGNQAPQE